MFDPVKVTTFVSLAAAAIWAVCWVRDAKRGTQIVTLVVTLGALLLTAWLEWSRHADPCSNSSGLRINEYCAEGDECDGGNDFVEVINLGDDAVDLGCYALTDRRSTRSDGRMAGNPFLLPPGQVLQPGAVRAWDEVDTRFQLSWRRGDRLRLSRLSLRPGEPVIFEQEDEVLVDSDRSYGFRSPSEFEWVVLSHEEAGQETELGTLGRANLNPPG